MEKNDNLMDKVTALAKRRGFIFPGSELYGGLANTYDYGPMGVELLRNIRNLWWETFVHRRSDIVGLEASLISHQKIWEASGHTAGFADALIDCKECKHRIRADHLIEDYLETNEEQLSFDDSNLPEGFNLDLLQAVVKQKKVEGLDLSQIDALISFFDIPCPNCKSHPSDFKNWTSARQFNLLFPVQLGIVVGDQNIAYLRGETAQGMFTNFHNIVSSTRVRLPFGIAQLGKSFRNEITPGNSVFRTLVFEQGEIEYFFDPEKEKWEDLFESWKESMWKFIIGLGIREENLRFRVHTDEERSFYSKRTEDLEYEYPFGYKELWGIAYRTNYDLAAHESLSKKELRIVDPQTNEKILPHVIEPAVGIDRIFLMVLCDSYYKDGNRVVLKLSPILAPYKLAVFPLLANKPELVEKAKNVYEMVSKKFVVSFDDRGNIGKRYLYQDEIGTPWCVTVDFQTLEDETVTIRDRDSGQQHRISISTLIPHVSELLLYN